MCSCPGHRECSGWACLLRKKGQGSSMGRHTWPCPPAFTRAPCVLAAPVGVLRGTRSRWAVANAILHAGHVALRVDSFSLSSAFISCACLPRVLSGLCRYKCPFCISPAPAGQPTIGCTFISARTSEREHTFFCRRQSASPQPLPARPSEVKSKMSSLGGLFSF